jgi:hypothetical protein
LNPTDAVILDVDYSHFLTPSSHLPTTKETSTFDLLIFLAYEKKRYQLNIYILPIFGPPAESIDNTSEKVTFPVIIAYDNLTPKNLRRNCTVSGANLALKQYSGSTENWKAIPSKLLKLDNDFAETG